MKGLRARLLVVAAGLAVVLAAAVPAMAEEGIEVECEGDDGAEVFCEERVMVSTGPSEEEGEEAVDPDPIYLEDCYPFCGVYWPF